MIVNEKLLKRAVMKAWASASSRERTNTKRNLARATTKSKSRMQTVSNGCVS